MTFAGRGLIIREQFTGESDRIVTVLTEERGVLRAFAPGARKIKSKNIAATQLLCFSDFYFSEHKGTYRITESKPIEVFFELRSNISRLALAQYFCEAVKVMAPEGENCREILRLILNSLKFLCDPQKDERQIKTVFELRLLCLSGYMPDLSSCAVCGKDSDTAYFSPVGGNTVCGSCIKSAAGKFYFLNGAMLSAARHICYSDFERIFKYKLDEKSAERLSEISEEYIIAQTEMKFLTLEFYKSL